MNYKEDKWEVSLHPLAPGIPLEDWSRMSRKEREKLEHNIMEHYEKIGDNQLRIHRLTAKLQQEFKDLPVWKKVRCWTAKLLDIIMGGGPSFLHNLDDSMAREHINEPHTFARLTYCITCGSSWYDRRELVH